MERELSGKSVQYRGEECPQHFLVAGPASLVFVSAW